jgi:hypothetical protein
MKTNFNMYYLFFIITIVLLILVLGCEKYEVDKPDYDRPIGNIPEITAISPADSAAVGVNFIEIRGTGFISSLDESYINVYFDGTAGTINSISDTLLQVLRPPVYGDSVTVAINIPDADVVAQTIYKIKQTHDTYGDLSRLGSQMFAVCFDENDNLYIAGTRMIFILRPGQDPVQYNSTPFLKYSDIKEGPDGFLYYISTAFKMDTSYSTTVVGNDTTIDTTIARIVNPKDSSFIYSIDPANITVIADPNNLPPHDLVFADLPDNVTKLDFDQYHNMYAGGSFGLYVIYPDGQTKDPDASYYIGYTIYTLRVTDEYVYVGAEHAGKYGIYRSAILNANGDLGAPELYFDWTANAGIFAGTLFVDMVISESGDIYLAINDSEFPYPIAVINSEDLTCGTMYDDGRIFSTIADNLIWGDDKYLYVNRGKTLTASSPEIRFYRINMPEAGRKYFGTE